MCRKLVNATLLLQKLVNTAFLSRKLINTRSSIAFYDLLDSSIAPHIMPHWSNVIFICGSERLVSCFKVRIMDDCQSLVSCFSCKLCFTSEAGFSNIQHQKNPGNLNFFCFPPFSSPLLDLSNVFPLHDHSKPFQKWLQNFSRMFFQISPGFRLLLLMHPSLVASRPCTSTKLTICPHQVFKALTPFKCILPSNSSNKCFPLSLFCPMQGLWWNYEWPK